MKTTAFFASLVLLFFASIARAQNVGVNTDGSSPDPSALLDLKSNSMGLLVPRMSSGEREGISGAATGLVVYDTSTGSFWYFNGSKWLELLPAGRVQSIQDADGDTRITTEKYTDSDQVHFKMGGTEYFNMKDGRLEISNTGQSVRIGVGAGGTIQGNQELVAVGDSALYENFYGIRNTALGFRSMKNNFDGRNNVAVGSSAMYQNEGGDDNSAIGNNALFYNQGNQNTAVGQGSMFLNASGSRNTSVGSQALYLNSTGKENTACGSQSLYSNISGSDNVALGYHALYLNSSGSGNVALGMRALWNSTEIDKLVAIGDSALFHNGMGAAISIHGTQNVAVGSKAMFENRRGFDNAALGYQALRDNTDGRANTAVGNLALYKNETGYHNTAVGASALASNIDGISNAAFGETAGYYSIGSHNLFLGAGSGYHSTGDRNVFIGPFAGQDASGDDLLYIENSLSNAPLVYGNFALDEVGINGTLGVGTGFPEKELHVLDGGDGDDDVIFRLQSDNANNDAILEFFENTVPAMSMHYSGSANAIYFVDLTQNPDTIRMTVERSGDVGIAKKNPSHLLDVGPNGAFCDGGVWVNGSSRAYKRDVHPLQVNDAREALQKLEPVRYRYKTNPDEEYIGFIAEDVPGLVATNDRSGVSSMDIVALLTRVVQEQQVQLDNLMHQVDELKIEIKDQKTERQ